MAIPAALLLLADPRLPAGSHAHSGTIEPAVAAGFVRDGPSLRSFLAGRLATTGLVSAAVAAAACLECAAPAPRWRLLDAEVDARTPSLAQRAASRAQGRGLLRAARALWPSTVGPSTVGPSTGGPSTVGPSTAAGVLDVLAAGPGRLAPHHSVVLGVSSWLAGGTPDDAATLAAIAALTGPASAAVRLLGLDPLAVHAVLAGLTAEVDAVSAVASAAAANATGPADLPAPSAPAMDVLAEQHRRQEVRLFES